MMEFAKTYISFLQPQIIYFTFFAGFAWLFFWGWKNPYTLKNRVVDRDFQAKDIQREVFYSLFSVFIFALIHTFVFSRKFQFIKPMASPIQESSWIVHLGWTLFITLFHDTYFYWSHRLLHHPLFFSKFHRTHHLSNNPTPWATFAFHPIEAILQVIWVVPLYLFLPITKVAWQTSVFLVISMTVLGHSNVEIFPKSWEKIPLLKYVSRGHMYHHIHSRDNYCIFFNFWDRWMKTLKD